MKRKLLFVSYRDGEFGHDLSYALDLAKMTDKGIAILLVNRKRLVDKFEDIMAGVTFAEAGEHDTAIEMMTPGAEDGLKSLLEKKCQESGMAASVYSAMHDAVSSLRDFVKKNKTVDMILLSPSITEDGEISPKVLKRLVLQTSSRPIVTMTRQAVATA
jgi:hypothetical protein